MNVDVSDLTFYLRHDDGGVARLECGDVFRGITDWDGFRFLNLDRNAGRALSLLPVGSFVRASGKKTSEGDQKSQMQRACQHSDSRANKRLHFSVFNLARPSKPAKDM